MTVPNSKQNILFIYIRTAQGPDGKKITNYNYLNPMSVVSLYWEQGDSGIRLNVFLTNGKSIVFGKEHGEALLSHMENFLRLVTSPIIQGLPPVTVQTEKRRSRPVPETQIVETDILAVGTEAQFE